MKKYVPTIISIVGGIGFIGFVTYATVHTRNPVEYVSENWTKDQDVSEQSILVNDGIQVYPEQETVDDAASGATNTVYTTKATTVSSPTAEKGEVAPTVNAGQFDAEKYTYHDDDDDEDEDDD